MDRGYRDGPSTSYQDYFECSPPVPLEPGETPSALRDDRESHSTTPVRHLRPNSSYNSTFYPPHFQPYMHQSAGALSTEQMLSTLLESQNKVVKMVENVSKRLGNLENVVADLSTKASDSIGTASSSSSPEEKKRLPPQLSVSYN